MYISEIEYKIPLNEKKNFIIKKNNWNSSLDIILTDGLNFNIKNLFLVFKCYFLTDRIYISSVYFIISNINRNDSFFTYKKINHKKIHKMSFFDFQIWIDDFLEEDKEYLKLYDFYGFRILFNYNSIINEKNILYPIYPWEKKMYDYYFEDNKNIMKKNLNMDYKIKYFKLLNTILKNKRIWYRSLSWKKRK